ncbi:FAD-dependent monooxygenase [Nonomuraea sp. NPDC050556]|uniref:FAD-dependent monooxygenase n=1 Tax=Nonomuraea sp. NPDC050556 TaxID=3364369 RepID=UPI0037BBB5B9
MDVLISGAGIAGPALAHWLVRAGHDVTVVERATGPRSGGQAVDFRGRAQMGVLERMGVLEEIRARQTHMGAVDIVDAGGSRLASLPSDLMSGEVEIFRGDLADVLRATTDATYVFDDSITALTETARGVEVSFERSADRRFDLVVGADGAHSAVRRLAFAPRAPHHLGFYAATFAVAERPGLRGRGEMFSVPGASAGVNGYAGRTIGAFHFAAPVLDVDYWDAKGQQDLLAERFAGVGWQVPELLREMRAAPDFYFAAAEQLRLDRYAKGRVVLLGDAAFGPGPGGMGSGLAVVGAYVLAGELAAAGGDHRVAFERYERELRPYVAVCQKQAQGADRFLVPGTERQIRGRDRTFRMLSWMPGKGLIAKLASRAANAIELKKY